jgi:hypothetical protein
MKKLPFLLLLALSGCITTDSQKRIADFMKTPAGQAIIHIATTTGTKAIDQFAATGKVDGKEIAKAALGGASAELRKAQTPDAQITAAGAKEAAKTAMNEGTGVPAVSREIAPAVAKAVADAVKNQGAPADLALEAAARGLDKAAASVK